MRSRPPLQPSPQIRGHARQSSVDPGTSAPSSSPVRCSTYFEYASARIASAPGISARLDALGARAAGGYGAGRSGAVVFTRPVLGAPQVRLRPDRLDALGARAGSRFWANAWTNTRNSARLERWEYWSRSDCAANAARTNGGSRCTLSRGNEQSARWCGDSPMPSVARVPSMQPPRHSCNGCARSTLPTAPRWRG